MIHTPKEATYSIYIIESKTGVAKYDLSKAFGISLSLHTETSKETSLSAEFLERKKFINAQARDPHHHFVKDFWTRITTTHT